MKPEELYSKMIENARRIPDKIIAASLEAQINLMSDMLRNAQEDARIDCLTQLPNYKGLIEILERETARAKRSNEPLVLGFIDFNKLKEYNDTYGHVQANHAIKQVAQTIKNSLRTQDSITRYGGDEFCFVLPKTDLESSKPVAGRIKDNIDSLVVEGIVEGLPDENYKKITASMGVTTLQEHENYMSLLNRANKAMKVAKTNSRIASSIVYV